MVDDLKCCLSKFLLLSSLLKDYICNKSCQAMLLASIVRKSCRQGNGWMENLTSNYIKKLLKILFSLSFNRSKLKSPAVTTSLFLVIPKKGWTLFFRRGFRYYFI